MPYPAHVQEKKNYLRLLATAPTYRYWLVSVGTLVVLFFCRHARQT